MRTRGTARTPGGPFALSAVGAVVLVCAGVLAMPRVAAASSITRPSRSPFGVAAGPAAFSLVASGFAPNTNVFAEQCDGMSPSDAQWSPTVNCDLGSSPPPVSADAQGAAVFDGTRIFQPFVGESPQALFNCLALGQPAPANHLRNFRNCQVRVSTNNSSRTSDQTFLILVLPAPSAATTTTVAGGASTPRAASPLVPRTPPTTTPGGSGGAKSNRVTGRATTTVARAGVASASAGAAVAATGARRTGTSASSTDTGAIAGYACIVIGGALTGAAWSVGRRRRRVNA